VELTFAPLTEGDLPLLHRWLNDPEVVRWWEGDDVSWDAVVRDHWESDEPTEHWIASAAGRPVGWIQCYAAADYPEEGDPWAELGADRTAAGIDYLIGQAGDRGRGVGTAVIRAFVAEVVFGRHPAWTQVCAAPDVGNVASWRALEKAGFRALGTVPGKCGPGRLMVLDRPAPPRFRYESPEEDSGRWLGFPFRDGDVVISTRSKSGTTWLQMMCALLIFQTSELPAPLARLSPWLDWQVRPRAEVFAELDAQTHRRFIKTHTPLDGIPIDTRATYLVAARHPLDMAVSLYHQGDNIDRARLRELTGEPEPEQPPKPRPELRERLLSWIDWRGSPQESMDSLPGVLWHLADAWSRRDAPNVVLFHYDDLSADLEGEMRRLAGRLGIEVPAERWSALVHAASFEHMRDNATQLAPGATGVLRDPARFFRQGRSGEGTALLSVEELARYRARAAHLAPADLLDWLHRGRV
jgi:RimJ/RimL family protein N-acetyltransferase